MATVYRKAKAGVEDLAFDDQGTGSTIQTPKSDGTYRTVRRINDTHIPTSAAVRSLSSTAITVYNAIVELWALVVARLPLAGGTMSGPIAMGASKITGLANGTSSGDALHVGQADGTTIEVNSGSLRVKDAGISAAKLATDAVETAKIKDDAVTTAKILDANVTNAKLAGSITAAKLTWTPGFYVFKSGITAALAGGGAAPYTQTQVVAGVAATDFVVATICASTNNTAVSRVIPSDSLLTFNFNADPGANTTVYYAVFRTIS